MTMDYLEEIQLSKIILSCIGNKCAWLALAGL